MKDLQPVIPIWIVANIMIGGSFLTQEYFWFLFPASLFALSVFSVVKEKFTDSFTLSFSTFLTGILSGLGIYAFFLFSYMIIKQLPFPLSPFVKELYSLVGPTEWWHFALLILLIVPGEELFWRGYMLNRLEKMGAAKSVIIAAALYAVAHIWTGNPMLIAAAFTAGIAWGYLYKRTGSLSVVIISHLIFDLWLLVWLPLTF